MSVKLALSVRMIWRNTVQFLLLKKKKLKKNAFTETFRMHVFHSVQTNVTRNSKVKAPDS